ncbi:MAG TPA: ABC transporter permease [Actinomycetota bacterium]|nr:ABC transporter permease [Actinomycetota bacterium]
MTSIRIFFIGGAIAYKALFNWIRPAIYIPTMLGSPLFQILFFAHLGRFSGLRDDSFFVIGNAVQACSMASIYAMTMTIANERYFGTLSALLATPANRFALFMGRALPPIANGLFVSVFGLVVGTLLLDFSLAEADLVAFALVLVATVLSCTCLGMMLGSIGLRARDVFFVSNLVYFLMLLFCGVNIPIESLPPWMEAIGRSVPLTHGIIAAREVAAGADLAAVGDLVRTELAIGAGYGCIAFGLFRYFELETRRRATLETY